MKRLIRCATVCLTFSLSCRQKFPVQMSFSKTSLGGCKLLSDNLFKSVITWWNETPKKKIVTVRSCLHRDHLVSWTTEPEWILFPLERNGQSVKPKWGQVPDWELMILSADLSAQFSRFVVNRQKERRGKRGNFVNYLLLQHLILNKALGKTIYMPNVDVWTFTLGHLWVYVPRFLC